MFINFIKKYFYMNLFKKSILVSLLLITVSFSGLVNLANAELGVNWTALLAGDTGINFGTTDVTSVAYGNGKFVAVGYSGKASYSSDGITWTSLSAGTDTGIKFGTNIAYSVTYGAGKFIVIGQGGKASYSSDGITWTSLPAGDDTGIKFGNSSVLSVTYGNDKFVAVGVSGKASYSSDGITWTSLPAGDDTGIKFGNSSVWSVTYGNDKFVAVGDSGKASYSSDGINWVSLPYGYDQGIKFTSAAKSVTYGNGKFVVVGGSGRASYSSNGINWTLLPGENVNTGIKFGTTFPYSVTYGSDRFVVVGDSGKASYSSDGINWTSLPAGDDTGIKFGMIKANSVTYGNDKFVAVGCFGVSSYSALDTTPPNLTSISSTITSSSATITWTTDEDATSQVQYGPSSSYGDLTDVTDLSGTTDHSVLLSDLLACTNYHYRVISTDLSDNTATSSNQTFSIGGCIADAVVTASSTEVITTSASSTLSITGLTLDVPVNYTATTSSATFQAKQLPKTTFFALVSAPTSFTPVGDSVYKLQAIINSTTTLSSFDEPLTITMDYDPTTLGDIDESTLTIYRYDAPTWTELSDCAVNTSLHTVTCTTNHFSDFALFGLPVVAEAPITTTRSGGTHYGCKDPNATNYNYFSSHRQSLCQYANTPVLALGNTIATTITPPSNYTFIRDLKLYTTSADVKALQQYLNSIGFTVSTTGPGSLGNETTFFGPKTQAAVISYQKAKGIIPAVGYFGPITRGWVGK